MTDFGDSFELQTLLEADCFLHAKVVAGGNDVAAMGVGVWVEVAEEGEHFGGVAAAAEDDEDSGWCAAFAGLGRAVVEAGEDGENVELRTKKGVGVRMRWGLGWGMDWWMGEFEVLLTLAGGFGCWV